MKQTTLDQYITYDTARYRADERDLDAIDIDLLRDAVYVDNIIIV